MTDMGKFAHFAFNYNHDFIAEAFKSLGENMVNHLKSKFNGIYNREGSRSVMISFYMQLDNGCRTLLKKYIAERKTS